MNRQRLEDELDGLREAYGLSLEATLRAKGPTYWRSYESYEMLLLAHEELGHEAFEAIASPIRTTYLDRERRLKERLTKANLTSAVSLPSDEIERN